MTGVSLAGRGAVVTGAGRGIGAAIARALAESGAAVMVAARTTDEVERVAAELAAHGARAWGAPCDVTDEDSVRRLGVAARARLIAIDILVNAAGDSSSAPLRALTLAEWNRVLAVNATGTFLCTREFVSDMVDRGFGRVINVASVAGLAGGKYVAHYAAAKHAVVGFTRSIAIELEGTGVTINALCPGYVDTPMTERTLARVRERTGLEREPALAAVLASAGQARLLAPGEVAAAALDLCREASRAVNGQAIRLDAKESAA